MAEVDSTKDILSTLPAWVQFAANMGVFIVAVAAASFGFVRKRIPTLAHEAVESVSHGDLLEGMNESLKSIASSAKTIAASHAMHDEENRIDKEVARRLAAERRSSLPKDKS